VLDLGFLGTVEHRRGKRHALAQVVGQIEDLGIGQAGEIFGLAGFVVDRSR
jgi:hypothetical protein